MFLVFQIIFITIPRIIKTNQYELYTLSYYLLKFSTDLDKLLHDSLN